MKLNDPDAVRGRRVLVVKDAPTITHGGMPYGAGFVAARAAGAAAIVDPQDAATPEIHGVCDKYPHIGLVLPTLGYTPEQLAALAATINAAAVVVAATPDRPCASAAHRYSGDSGAVRIPPRSVRRRWRRWLTPFLPGCRDESHGLMQIKVQDIADS